MKAVTAEAFAILIACAVPTVALIVVVGLFATLKDLERSRDELAELKLRSR